MISDPTGILSRVPELEPLAEDPKVRKAIERGDLHRLYRVLWWANLLGRLRAHRETLKVLLARRRLFLLPIRSAPTLTTYNGCGATAYGHADPDPEDQTYILTHYFVLALVPLFPVRAYLVRDGERSGFRRSWSFIGKVPFGPITYLWNRFLALAVVAGVLAGVGSVWFSSRFHPVHLINGSGIPVRVTIGQDRVDLPPDAQKTVKPRVGKQHVRVTSADGSTILEEADLALESGRNVVVFNVLGAAPVVYEHIFYGRPINDPHERRPELGCARSVLRYEKVDYAFREPPRSISLSEHSPGETRSHLTVVPGGLKVCIGYLSSRNRRPEAAALSRRIAEVTQCSDGLAASAAASLTEETDGLEKALAFLTAARAAHPEQIDVHRIYQFYASAAGHRAEVLAEYGRLHQANPQDPDLAYLLARMQRPAEATPLLEELVKSHPAHVWARRALVFNQLRLRHFEAALASWKTLRQLSHEPWERQVEPWAGAMVATGKGRAALTELQEKFELPNADRPLLAGVYARVAGVIGSDPEVLFHKLDGESSESAAWQRALGGLPVDHQGLEQFSEGLREGIPVIEAARIDAGGALALAVRAKDPARALEETTWALLYAEAFRQGDARAMHALEGTTRMSSQIARALRTFVESGTIEPALEDAAIEVTAAAEFVRSRKAGLPAPERARLLASAKEDDQLHGLVTAAIHGWKPAR
jgi:tetratricopeptide (TPR) repeat protein